MLGMFAFPSSVWSVMVDDGAVLVDRDTSGGYLWNRRVI